MKIYEHIKTETNPDLWEVGFFKVDGNFFTESFHTCEEKAEKRENFINEQKLVSYDPDEIKL